MYTEPFPIWNTVFLLYQSLTARVLVGTPALDICNHSCTCWNEISNGGSTNQQQLLGRGDTITFCDHIYLPWGSPTLIAHIHPLFCSNSAFVFLDCFQPKHFSFVAKILVTGPLGHNLVLCAIKFHSICITLVPKVSESFCMISSHPPYWQLGSSDFISAFLHFYLKGATQFKVKYTGAGVCRGLDQGIVSHGEFEVLVKSPLYRALIEPGHGWEGIICPSLLCLLMVVLIWELSLLFSSSVW